MELPLEGNHYGTGTIYFYCIHKLDYLKKMTPKNHIMTPTFQDLKKVGVMYDPHLKTPTANTAVE
jgi:hypothetical protein